MKDRKLVDAERQARCRFEILLDEPTFERVALPYVQWLARLGIDARVRTVDPAQYQQLTDTYDFDMTMTVYRRVRQPRQRAGRLLDLRARPSRKAATT